jgi:hypothetical protein
MNNDSKSTAYLCCVLTGYVAEARELFEMHLVHSTWINLEQKKFASFPLLFLNDMIAIRDCFIASEPSPEFNQIKLWFKALLGQAEIQLIHATQVKSKISLIVVKISFENVI